MTDPSKLQLHPLDLAVCPDCGEPLDRHCAVYPYDGPMFLQCPTPSKERPPWLT